MNATTLFLSTILGNKFIKILFGFGFNKRLQSFIQPFRLKLDFTASHAIKNLLRYLEDKAS